MFLCAAGSSTAFADETVDAKASFGQGVEHYSEGDYSAALDAFQMAYALKPHPSVLVNIANCQEKLSRHIDAADTYDRYYQQVKRKLSGSQRSEVQRKLQSLQAKIGRIKLSTAPHRVLVSIDGGSAKEMTDRQIAVLGAGEHVIEASAEGYVSKKMTVTVKGTQTTGVDLALEKVVELAAKAPRAKSKPNEAPNATQKPSKLERRAEQSITEPSDVNSESFNDNANDNAKDGIKLTTPFWIASGITLALAAATTTTGLLALSAEDDFEKSVVDSNNPLLPLGVRAQAIEDGRDASSRANTLSTVTDVLLVSTLVSAGATVWALFSSQPEQKEVPTLSAAPFVGQEQVGVEVKGRF